MDWTTEGLQAEIDYRQASLRRDAAHYRVSRQSLPARPSWWRRLGHRPGPDLQGEPNGHRDNGHRDAA
ncbi:hypothetical protein F4560_004820 [Saccharothrix ecbatanensis]|jgi:hypothetical protein|uniref:Uncharacterized protein n=1 Tax=Saccharothrix ecbatanensis TaxID=1105145 RepID=A0A7W9HMJ9_9PSEU|nr:hypothetical protein [Saccharothrix ecbatanensis]MBB5805052.1 hypothetical protein [Saccharothrix ecbatanensis]